METTYAYCETLKIIKCALDTKDYELRIDPTSQTKHADIRFKFVNKCVQDGIVKIIFIRPKENNEDIFTKNLNGELDKYNHNNGLYHQDRVFVEESIFLHFHRSIS